MFKLSSWFGKGGEPRTFCATLVLLFTFLSITFVLVMSVAKIYLLEGVRSKENEAFYVIERAAGNRTSKPTFTVQVQVLAVDPLLFTCKLSVKLIRTDLNATVPDNTQIVLGGSLVSINNDTMELEKELSSVTLSEGNVNLYPYDHYAVSLPFGQRRRQRKHSPDVSFVLIANGALQNWRIRLAFAAAAKSPALVDLHVVMFRPWSTRIFSMFIVGSMWLVTVAVVCITFQIVVGDREINPPIMGMFVALLFALPTVRNMQPNAPPIGTLMDVTGLLFNMLFTLICLIKVMIIYMIQTAPPMDSPSK